MYSLYFVEHADTLVVDLTSSNPHEISKVDRYYMMSLTILT
jgi:hypothetical protein